MVDLFFENIKGAAKCGKGVGVIGLQKLGKQVLSAGSKWAHSYVCWGLRALIAE